jgi:hypothetical protein
MSRGLGVLLLLLSTGCFPVERLPWKDAAARDGGAHDAADGAPADVAGEDASDGDAARGEAGYCAPGTPPDGGACTCNGDVNGDGPVSALDWVDLRNCLFAAAGHGRADVDCDGDVDRCDLAKVDCILLSGVDGGCCESIRCGACWTDTTCASTTHRDCTDPGGCYLGDNTACDVPDAGDAGCLP